MSLYTFTGKSATAAASGTNLFNLIGTSSAAVKLERVVFGSEGGTTPSQITIGLFRATARGTQSTTAAPLSTSSISPASVTTVDTAWSVAATLGAVPLIKRSFDCLSESEWVIEDILREILDTGVGTANGLCAQIVDNALATGISVVWTGFERE